ncbi:MAG: hypothetical protein ABSA33_01575 [Candidatus Micrarchaeaceae archaeon]|jgi:hypothetical protein
MRRGTAPALAALILFGILLSVGSTYFYTTLTSERYYDQQVAQDLKNKSQIQQSTSQLLVYGTVITGQLLSFYVNNTGTGVTISAWWIMNGTNAAVIQYENSTKLPHTLPFYIGQGQSVVFSTNITASTSITQTYMIKVLTSSGIAAVGSYPNGYLSTAALNSDVAAGLGSAKMTFDSFTYYDYISGPPSTDSDRDFENLCDGGVQCNGGSNIINMNGHSGSLVPEGQNHTGSSGWGAGCGYCGITVPIVFSVNITNVDPQQSDLVFNSEANLWVIETCDAGTPTSSCGETSPVYVFYMVNVNQATGAITSLSSSTFSQVQIPYGVTKTIFFASAYPLQSQAFRYMSLTTDDTVRPGNNLAVYGQFAVFLLLPGTKIPPTGVQLYGQNIPFESTISGDNVGWYSETPNTCIGDSDTVFQLQVNNSVFSGANINQIMLNASAFSSIAATAPSGWTDSVNNGVIIWTNTNDNSPIAPGSYATFAWSGLAPSTSYSVQDIFPLTMYWDAGSFAVLQAAEGCFVNANIQFPLPKTIPTGVLFYVPITLTNLQTSAVTGGTQVELNMNWDLYASYLDSPVDNVLFFDYSGNSLNAWLANGTSSGTTNAILWLKLNSTGIAALSSSTIYMGFYTKGASHLSSSGPFGEAPQLSSTYAQYDDGSKVFLYYNNGVSTSGLNVVNGGAISTSAQTSPYGGTSGVLALTGSGSLTTSSETVAWYTTALVGDNFIVEGWTSISTNLNALFAVRGSSSSTLTNYIMGDGWKGSEASIGYESGTTNNLLSGTGSRTTGWHFDQAIISGSSLTVNLYTGADGTGTLFSSTSTTDTTLGASNHYVGLESWASSTTAAYFFGWRIRIDPPNDVLPSVIYGQLTVG